MSHSGIIHVARYSCFSINFAVLVTNYEGKFTLIAQRLHNLSATDDAMQLQNDKLSTLLYENFTSMTEQLHNVSATEVTNQLHSDELFSLLQENVKLQNDQIAKAVIEASANKIVKH